MILITGIDSGQSTVYLIQFCKNEKIKFVKNKKNLEKQCNSTTYSYKESENKSSSNQNLQKWIKIFDVVNDEENSLEIKILNVSWVLYIR